jgi:hypothetical protein
VTSAIDVEGQSVHRHAKPGNDSCLRRPRLPVVL